jgi:hypothetical protein
LTEPEPGEDWAAVADAVQARSRELNMSTAELARQTGLSETTIRYLGTARRNKACLVAISAVLRWRFDHLTNILNGQPEKNVHVRPPALANLERIMHEEIAPLRQQLASLTETVRKTTAQLDAITSTQRQPPPPQRQGTT